MNPIRTVRAVVGWTQSRLAVAAGTSQPTIAAYESNSKSPAWRTIERVAGAAGLACYPAVTTPMTRDQERSLALHQAISGVLADEPDAVIGRARANVATMRAASVQVVPLIEEWENILATSPTRIASAMLDPGLHGRDLRQVTPFAGVLSVRQRSEVYTSFRSAA